jgi:hypothetical protein
VRVLIVTKIFPNAAEPLSAPFNRQQFRALAALPGLDVTVLGTIPWFPGARLLARWSSAGRVAAVPAAEIIDGLPVEHPRTLFIPRLAHGTWGPLYAASLLPAWRRHRGQVDVVLGSWAYPDGFAAVLLARALGVPAVVKLHGSDINVMAQEPGPRAQLAWALPRAAAVVAVSRPLADEVARSAWPRRASPSSATASTASASAARSGGRPGRARPRQSAAGGLRGQPQAEQGRARPAGGGAAPARAGARRRRWRWSAAARRARRSRPRPARSASRARRRAVRARRRGDLDGRGRRGRPAELGRGHAQRAAGGAGVRSPRRRHPRRRDTRRGRRPRSSARWCRRATRRRWPTRWRRRWSRRTIRAAIAAAGARGGWASSAAALAEVLAAAVADPVSRRA